MRKSKRVLHFLTGASFLISAALTVSSCSSRRPLIPVNTADAAIPIRTEKASASAKNDGCRPEECVRSAIKDLAKGDLLSAEQKLEEVREGYPNTLWAARASFLLAGVTLARGGDATALLEETEPLSRIPDYILFYKGRAFYQAMRPDEAVEAYDSLIQEYPDSALAPDALFRKGLIQTEQGGYSEARKTFGEFISSFPKDLSVPEALIKMAECSMKLGEPAQAAGPLKKVLVYYATDKNAPRAKVLLDEIKGQGVEVQAFTGEEEFERAKRLFFNASYKDAIDGFFKVIREKESPFFDAAYMKKAVAEIRLKQYADAEKTLKDYLATAAPRKECEALYWLGAVYLRTNDEGGLLKIDERLSASCPAGTERPQVLLYLGRLYAEKGLKEKSRATYKRVIEGYKGSIYAEDAAWSLGWSSYRAGRFEEAYNDFLSLIEARPNGGKTGQFLYWAGKSLERMGRNQEAARVYERLSAVDDGYYSMMARQRQGLVRNDAPLQEKEPYAPETEFKYVEPPAEYSVEYPASKADSNYGIYKEKEGLAGDSHYRASLELLLLGLNEEAAQEADLLAKRYSEDKGALSGLAELARLFYEAGDYYRALKLHQGCLSKGAKGQGEASEAFAFPPGLVEDIKERVNGAIDPHLVAAIIREESHFNPDAVSSAGALGIMQIMPSTGAFIARELNRAFDVKYLLDPSFSIELGSWYLGHLAKRFDGDLVLAIAGYNAGPGAAARWKETLPPELDEFIESIPYAETRSYAKKVLRSYARFLNTPGSNGADLSPIVKRVRKRDKDVKINHDKGRS
ncbi:MAG: transglycosylase SLT domain-containing protein [Deltaproteobacteria bacterium]|nr:transglycosylase SLT domain-containing protein [Deltaproteobacteria bacterium]